MLLLSRNSHAEVMREQVQKIVIRMMLRVSKRVRVKAWPSDTIAVSQWHRGVCGGRSERPSVCVYLWIKIKVKKSAQCARMRSPPWDRSWAPRCVRIGGRVRSDKQQLWNRTWWVSLLAARVPSRCSRGGSAMPSLLKFTLPSTPVVCLRPHLAKYFLN